MKLYCEFTNFYQEMGQVRVEIPVWQRINGLGHVAHDLVKPKRMFDVLICFRSVFGLLHQGEPFPNSCNFASSVAIFPTKNQFSHSDWFTHGSGSGLQVAVKLCQKDVTEQTILIV